MSHNIAHKSYSTYIQHALFHLIIQCFHVASFASIDSTSVSLLKWPYTSCVCVCRTCSDIRGHVAIFGNRSNTAFSDWLILSLFYPMPLIVANWVVITVDENQSRVGLSATLRTLPLVSPEPMAALRGTTTNSPTQVLRMYWVRKQTQVVAVVALESVSRCENEPCESESLGFSHLWHLNNWADKLVSGG